MIFTTIRRTILAGVGALIVTASLSGATPAHAAGTGTIGYDRAQLACGNRSAWIYGEIGPAYTTNSFFSKERVAYRLWYYNVRTGWVVMRPPGSDTSGFVYEDVVNGTYPVSAKFSAGLTGLPSGTTYLYAQFYWTGPNGNWGYGYDEHYTSPASCTNP